jgi:hypothetical protein
MRTIADIGNDIHGTNPVAMYVSPTHDATLARAIQIPGSDQCRYLYLLIVWQRPSGPATDKPCLIISSETVTGGGETVLGVYEATGHQILHDERGDWTDIAAFGYRAVALASHRLATTFVEHELRKKDP